MSYDDHNFEVKDKVRVNDHNLATYGRTGTVVRTDYPYNGLIVVKFDDTQNPTSATIRHEKLSHMNSSSTTDQTAYLAFVHYHDDDDNPTNLSEAISMFTLDELGQPELTLYDTKDEILNEIRNDVDFPSYRYCFIVMDNEVYPVETEIKINW